jgi:aminopeptidase YwaD
MRAIVEELSADRYAGRRVGTDGGWAAVSWLADLLRQLGAAVEVDHWVRPGAVRDVYAIPELIWESERLRFRRDFCEHLASADQPTVHRGQLARSIDEVVPGAWVLEESFVADRAAELGTLGAGGLLVRRGTDADGWMPKMIAGPDPAPLPVLAVRGDLHERMAAAVGSWVTGSVPLRTVDAIGTNVYGTFRPAAAGRLGILLTAHFDGVGDDPDGTRFPASADNASGVAVVVEAARSLHQVLPAGVGLRVALLDGEEVGAWGSAHHAARVSAGTFVINVDGAAGMHEAAAVEAGGPAHALLAALDQAGRAAGVALRPAAMASDNRRYAAAGLPSIGLGFGIPGYQTPAETPDRVDPSTLDAALRLVVATVLGLATPKATG